MRNPRYSAAMRIIKKAEAHTDFWASWEEDGAQCVLDGVRAVALRGASRLNNLPVSTGGRKFDSFMRILKNYSGVSIQLYDAPTPAELRSLVQSKTDERPDLYKGKGRHAVLYRVKNGPLVNAEYLRDMLILLPNAYLYSANGSLYFCDPKDNSEGILMRVNEKAVPRETLPT